MPQDTCLARYRRSDDSRNPLPVSATVETKGGTRTHRALLPVGEWTKIPGCIRTRLEELEKRQNQPLAVLDGEDLHRCMETYGDAQMLTRKTNQKWWIDYKD